MAINKSLLDELLSFLKNGLFKEYRLLRVDQIKGDASTREYFRVKVESPAKNTQKSYIIMKSINIEDEFIPFIDIHQALLKLAVPVPTIFHSDVQSGMILEEDCGEQTFENAVRGLPEKERDSLYKKALDNLVTMQFNDRHHTFSCIAYNRFFDTNKFLLEIDFMMTHLLKGLCGSTVKEKDSHKITTGFRLLSDELSSEPRVFTHRDYHSRNIMVQDNGEIKVLDFQDARMGPCQYDLASLLKDSYSPLSSEQVDNLLEYYLQKSAERNIQFDNERFVRIFNFMTVQRCLKAAGTFAYQKVEKENEEYLPYIKPALRLALESMNKHRELFELRDILFHYLKPLKLIDLQQKGL